MKTNKPKIYFLTVLLTFFLLHIQAQNVYKKISAFQSDSLIKANTTNPNFVILDVRTPGSWQSDHIQYSINRNYYDADFNAQLDALPKHKMYLIHCQSGGRSRLTFTKMQDLKFSTVYEMLGGISAWKSAGYPTTNRLSPQIMLVGSKLVSKAEALTDTIDFTITNRGNDTLQINSLVVNDMHATTNNFESDKKLAGAQDYTFSLFHASQVAENETISIEMNSNAGPLNFEIVIKNGIIQNSTPLENPKFEVYPNPVTKLLYFSGNNSKTNNIVVYNLNGRPILIKNNILQKFIDLQDLPNGIYFVKLTAGDYSATKKIIKID